MSRFFVSSVAALVLVCGAGSAGAESIIFYSSDNTTQVGWKIVNIGQATGVGDQGYWDRASYDTDGTSTPVDCSAASLLAGVACSWAGGMPIATPTPASPGEPYEYFAVTNNVPGETDIPANFFFRGPFVFDWTVLYQLTEWATDIEFGWYTAGHPDDRHVIFGQGKGSGGPFDLGQESDTEVPTGDFGFYYHSLKYGTIFFTESRFNELGAYGTYFFEPQFNGAPLTSMLALWLANVDDETLYLSFGFGPMQQFGLFRQGNMYWLGLEDQVGRASATFCGTLAEQPCSDYDFNDFLITWTVPEDTVPEPTSLALLGLAGLGLAWRRRRG